MPDFIVIPPHVKQARRALAGAGFDVTQDSPAFAALIFCSLAYTRTPQVNQADELREQLAALQRENHRLGAELLREANLNDNLRARLVGRLQRGHPELMKPEISGFTLAA